MDSTLCSYEYLKNDAKDNLNLIRDEMDEMSKDGDDKTDPEKFKNEKEKASVLLN